MRKQWFDRKLEPVERLILENQHMILYYLRNTAPNKILYESMQRQMEYTRNHLDNDDRIKTAQDKCV